MAFDFNNIKNDSDKVIDDILNYYDSGIYTNNKWVKLASILKYEKTRYIKDNDGHVIYNYVNKKRNKQTCYNYIRDLFDKKINAYYTNNLIYTIDIDAIKDFKILNKKKSIIKDTFTAFKNQFAFSMDNILLKNIRLQDMTFYINNSGGLIFGVVEYVTEYYVPLIIIPNYIDYKIYVDN